MKGLLIKDFKLLKGQKNFFMTITAISIIMIIVSPGTSFPIGFLGFVGALFSLSSISYDEFDNGNAFLFSLPITRKDYVLEKYIFGLISGIMFGLLPAMVHWWLFGVWIIGLIVLFSVLVKSYTGVLLGTGGSVLGVYLISFFPKAWKYTPTTLMESASLLIGTKSIEDYGIAVLITILLVVICLIVSITVMNRKQL